MDEIRCADGSAGDVDYGEIGGTYSRFRKPDPTIAAHIHRALGDAKTVLNVGAGALEDVENFRIAGEIHAGFLEQNIGVVLDQAQPFLVEHIEGAETAIDVGRPWGLLARRAAPAFTAAPA